MTLLAHDTADWVSPESVDNDLAAQHSNTWIVFAVLPDWAVLNLIVQVNIGLDGWTGFGQVWAQVGVF